MVNISTADGLFTIVDACPKLHALNLTGCRGVKVGDRRRFFEVGTNNLRALIRSHSEACLKVWEEHKERSTTADSP